MTLLIRDLFKALQCSPLAALSSARGILSPERFRSGPICLVKSAAASSQAGWYLLPPARNPSLTGGVRAILDTPLKFNHDVAEAELSFVLLSELVHLNIALRVSCAVSCPVALRACCTASKALAPVRGARREPSPFVHTAGQFARSHVVVQDCTVRYRYLPYTDKSGGDSPGQLICRLWHGIASQFSGQNIYLPSQTVILVSNAYMVPVHVPYCR